MKYSIFSVQDHYPRYGKRTVPELYGQIIRQSMLAEELGYEGFFVAEHHFHEYGVVPNPAVMLSSIAQKTSRLKLGSAISILTFHNPLVVAENYGMLDVISNGRLAFGVGSGYLKHEYAGFGIHPEERRDRFDENLMLVERLIKGERVSFSGKYNNIDQVQINCPAIQKDLPIYVAVLRKEVAYYVGRQGRRLMSVPYASVDHFDEIGEMVSEYQRGRREVGIEDHADSSMFVLHAHVAETDEIARQHAEDAFNLYVDTRLYAKRANYDDILSSGLSLFGSVETVVEKIVKLHQMGVDHVLTLQNFGLMPMELACRSMRMLAEEVMPKVLKRLEK